MLLLPKLLKRSVKKGQLTVIEPNGRRHVFGPGPQEILFAGQKKLAPAVTVRFSDNRIEREIFLNPEMALAEGYMDGRVNFEDGSTIHDLLSLFWMQRTEVRRHPLQQAIRKARFKFRRWQMHNPLGAAGRKVKSHYDIPTAFYRLWLDDTMTYSCAYWHSPDVGLEAAQQAKLRHIAAKLKIEPGMRVLDIGSGWGELAIYLAKACGAKVTGLNVSPDQMAAAQKRADAAGMGEAVAFINKDYRELTGSFDRIVSVGMMEHVGVAHYPDYFGRIRDLLEPDGIALVHCIGRAGGPGFTGPFFEKYIFPGGYAPAMSEVFAAQEQTGLWASDCEFWRRHYHWTLEAWRQRFMARRAEVVAMMGERFARMWEFYLCATSISFDIGGDMVVQLLLGPHKSAVPVVRDYIRDDEIQL
ncbi:class I SAM-dependent methyltransferase, partial [Salmonella enterica subsp. enterica]|nr:class I SAM-dependent methyltransferase [Salmonella enterica subsp. enterica serovar Enteritidis]